MDRGGDEDDAASGALRGRVDAVGWVGRGGVEEVGETGFEGVVGAEDVDIYYGFEGVGRELGERGEEVACCSGSVGRKGVWLDWRGCMLDRRGGWV